MSDLPPRTWRQWWLAWPKWFRIGCRAALGVVLLDIAFAVRIMVGLNESAVIADLRRRGADITYFFQRRSEPFRGYRVIEAGLCGLSPAYVDRIVFANGSDDDLRLIAETFPNLETLHFEIAEITPEGVDALRQCRKLRILGFRHTNLDDRDLEVLAEIKSLKKLVLESTLVSDASLPLLKDMNLESINLSESDVTADGIDRWLNNSSGVNPKISVYSATRTYCTLCWSDGRRSIACDQPIQLTVSGNDQTGTALKKVFEFDVLINRGFYRNPIDGPPDDFWTSKVCPEFANGERTFVLRIGEFESKPIGVVIEDDRLSSYRLEFQMPCSKAEALQATSN